MSQYLLNPNRFGIANVDLQFVTYQTSSGTTETMNLQHPGTVQTNDWCVLFHTNFYDVGGSSVMEAPAPFQKVITNHGATLRRIGVTASYGKLANTDNITLPIGQNVLHQEYTALYFRPTGTTSTKLSVESTRTDKAAPSEITANSRVYMVNEDCPMILIGHTLNNVSAASANFDYNNPDTAHMEVPFSYALTATGGTFHGLTFSELGEHFYMARRGAAADGTANIMQWTMSSPWNVITATINTGSQNVTSGNVLVDGVTFGNNGSIVYTTASFSTIDNVYSYMLTEAWNIASMSTDYDKYLKISGSTNPVDIRFKPDGTKMYILDAALGNVRSYSLSESWNVQSATELTNERGRIRYPTMIPVVVEAGMHISSDGLSLFEYDSAVGFTSSAIYLKRYPMTEAWNVGTSSFDGEYWGIAGSGARGLYFNNIGNIVFVHVVNNNFIKQGKLDVPYVFYDSGAEKATIIKSNSQSYWTTTAYKVVNDSPVNWNLRAPAAADRIYTELLLSFPRSKGLAFVTESISNTDSVLVPTAAANGDIAILFDVARQNTGNVIPPTGVLPTGWISIANIALSTAPAHRSMISYKTLDETDRGNSTIGMVSGTEGTGALAAANSKILLIYRPTFIVNTITLLANTGNISVSAVPEETMPISGNSGPILAAFNFAATTSLDSRVTNVSSGWWESTSNTSGVALPSANNAVRSIVFDEGELVINLTGQLTQDEGTNIIQAVALKFT